MQNLMVSTQKLCRCILSIFWKPPEPLVYHQISELQMNSLDAILPNQKKHFGSEVASIYSLDYSPMVWQNIQALNSGHLGQLCWLEISSDINIFKYQQSSVAANSCNSTLHPKSQSNSFSESFLSSASSTR